MFSGVVNPSTGKLEWIQQSEDVSSETADISQELARSQYGDMLHDKQRNHLYQRGLEMAIAEVKASGREPRVLDIGTGTGLLAMMAAKAGAKKVTACEVLRPMVKIARQVIAQNGFSDVIRIISKRSTEMTTEDMECRANILVTEVFDTELIGEGALVTFAHAHKHLLEPNSVVVPSSSRMFVRLVESDFLWRAHKILPDQFPMDVKLPTGWAECAGCPSVRDCHVEEIQVPQKMRMLSSSKQVASFDFSDPTLSPDCYFPPVEFSVTCNGLSHGLVVWWDITLGDTVLSMEPWEYPQWRDHWLQAVYLWPQPVKVKKGFFSRNVNPGVVFLVTDPLLLCMNGELVKVGLQHDDYSIWFSFDHKGCSPRVVPIERPLCTCGVHTSCSRYRVYSYNNSARTSTYLKVFSKVLLGKSTVLCMGDGSLLPLLLLLLRRNDPKLDLPEHYYVVSHCTHSSAVVRDLLKANNLASAVTFLDKCHDQVQAEDFECKQVEAIIAEPFFTLSLLPWHNLHFWYAANSLMQFVSPQTSSTEPVLFPWTASLMAIAVKFEDLYKMRAPVGFVEGFDITAFDQVVGKYLTTPEGIEAEPHPLWEYHSCARSKIHRLMTFDFSENIQGKSLYEVDGEIILNKQSGPCNGVVLWLDYTFQEDTVISTGLLSQSEIDSGSKMLEWDPGFKQAVYFLAPKYINKSLIKLDYHIEFSSSSGNIDMTFSGIH